MLYRSRTIGRHNGDDQLSGRVPADGDDVRFRWDCGSSRVDQAEGEHTAGAVQFFQALKFTFRFHGPFAFSGGESVAGWRRRVGFSAARVRSRTRVGPLGLAGNVVCVLVRPGRSGLAEDQHVSLSGLDLNANLVHDF